MFAEVDELEVVVDEIAYELGRHLREHDLPAVCRRHDSGGAGRGEAEVVAVARLRRAGVDSDADPQGNAGVPRFGVDGVNAGGGGLDRVDGGREHRVDPVTGRLDHVSTVRLDRLAQDRVVARQSDVHRVGMRFPLVRGFLEIGEQEGHRARRQLCHPGEPLSSA